MLVFKSLIRTQSEASAGCCLLEETSSYRLKLCFTLSDPVVKWECQCYSHWFSSWTYSLLSSLFSICCLLTFNATWVFFFFFLSTSSCKMPARGLRCQQLSFTTHRGPVGSEREDSPPGPCPVMYQPDPTHRKTHLSKDPHRAPTQKQTSAETTAKWRP